MTINFSNIEDDCLAFMLCAMQYSLKRTPNPFCNDLSRILVAELKSRFGGLFGGGGVDVPAYGDVAGPGTSPMDWLDMEPRAMGGPVWPGRAFLVGEQGPEMFLPNTMGQIKPISGILGGGEKRGGKSIIINMKVATQDAGSFHRNRGHVMTDLHRAINTAARRNGL